MCKLLFQDMSIDRIIIHFNRKHNEDSTIPPWVVKHRGKSYYVHHFEVSPGVGFSSKETPDNPHTKGSIQIKGRLEIYEENQQINAKIL